MAEMIYLVTRGEYSDYGVLAAFSSRALAEAYIDEGRLVRDNGTIYHGHRIEEYPIDLPVHWGPQIALSMSKEGTVIESRPAEWVKDPTTSFRVVRFTGKRIMENLTESQVDVVVATDDEKRAIKVANEIRTWLLATNNWNWSNSRRRIIRAPWALIAE